MVLGRSMKVVFCAAVAIMMSRGKAIAQVLTNTSNGVLTASLPFGNLTPGASTTPSSTQVQFRLRSNDNNGYKLLASAVFNVTPTGLVEGGTTVSASDIGVGITAIVPGNAVQTPRVDTIATGFNYNPASVAAVNGLTPYTSAASGRATLRMPNPIVAAYAQPSRTGIIVASPRTSAMRCVSERARTFSVPIDSIAAVKSTPTISAC